MSTRLFQRLRHAGVMGINRRNADFTLVYNTRRLYPLVDDKYRTKQLAQAAGIAVPTLYAKVEIERQVRDLADALQPYHDFVVKPARGSGGDGIVIVESRNRSGFRKLGGALLRLDELQHHVHNILSGVFSLGGQPDIALIEYRVKPDPVFAAVNFQGVPDVRIVVFLGVPVMAMVRLPTRTSEGRANLHQGALGVGIDLGSGATTGGVWRNRPVTEHPDTGESLAGIVIPHWEELLELAARCYELTGLGYQGVDFVLDIERGPLMLELNARPGLNIQLANGVGLLHRLERVRAETDVERVPVAERVRRARAWFGGVQSAT